MKASFQWLLVFLLCWLAECSSFQRDLTVNVAAGKSDCFYQTASEGQLIDIEYQVIDGRLGSLDIGFVLLAPGGRVLQAPGRRQSWSFRDTAPVTGDYRFCFDNTHSSFNYKTVYFDVMIDDPEEDEDDPGDDSPFPDTAEASTDADVGLLGSDWHRRMSELVLRLRAKLGHARRLQEAAASSAARDSHYAESALTRVTVCSAGQTLAMLAIGTLQVILVRSLFDETSRLHNLLKRIPTGGT